MDMTTEQWHDAMRGAIVLTTDLREEDGAAAKWLWFQDVLTPALKGMTTFDMERLIATLLYLTATFTDGGELAAFAVDLEARVLASQDGS